MVLTLQHPDSYTAPSLIELDSFAVSPSPPHKSSYPDVSALAAVLRDAKAEDVLILDVREKTSLTDYFLIASGTSPRHLNALMHRTLDFLSEEHGVQGVVEGAGDATWIVVDAGDIIVHLFHPDARRLYELEKVWGD